jgi:N-acetylglucosamine kinase-like BadF-type ATPase
MKLFLAVDGGQTSTKAVLADAEGRILARTSAGPSNHTEESGGPERLSRVTRSIVAGLFELAGINGAPSFVAACFGMTGETAMKTRILREVVSTGQLSVVHDSVNALEGASAGEPGIIVIAGTGSVARGRNARGRDLRVGGWGHLFGDEGSAYWIGREAIRAAAAEADGFGQKTHISRLLLERLSATSAYHVMEMYYSGRFGRDHLAGLAVWVNEAAERGDSVAERILKEAGRLLAQPPLAIIPQLFNRESGADSTSVYYSGGVFDSRIVVSSFRSALLSTAPKLRIQPPSLSPVFGSLILAYRSAGVVLSENVYQDWKDTSANSGNGGHQ